MLEIKFSYKFILNFALALRKRHNHFVVIAIAAQPQLIVGLWNRFAAISCLLNLAVDGFLHFDWLRSPQDQSFVDILYLVIQELEPYFEVLK